jgi:hypothetical protein
MMTTSTLWRGLGVTVSELDLKILAGGQSFRWELIGENLWRSVLEGKVINLQQTGLHDMT